ncbi:MAG: 3-phosphoserine/phosphohydroxythreonine transaminase [Desulfobacteraceae bacterium]
MSGNRIYNFNAGPAALPLSVLEKARDEFLDFRGSGMSITEISHRSKWFEGVLNDAVTRVRRLLGLGPDFEVLFVQGGASLQFCMVPMNLAVEGRPAGYINTGTWSNKAIQEARHLGKDVHVAASSEDRGFCYIPRTLGLQDDLSYLHFTSNNTIKGTQWGEFPDAGEAPLISDMSSDIMSRPFDPAGFGLIYAGAQKNIGPAGVALVIIRRDMLDRVPEGVPTLLSYKTYADKHSMFNTPPCFAIYMISLVLGWLEDTVGGLEEMGGLNRKKAALLYDVIDRTEFYQGTADPDSRSLMNVTFRLADQDLEARFVKEALEAGMGGLKGHRSVGGCRASIYNAVCVEAVEALAEFMAEFERKYG